MNGGGLALARSMGSSSPVTEGLRSGPRAKCVVPLGRKCPPHALTFSVKWEAWYSADSEDGEHARKCEIVV